MNRNLIKIVVILLTSCITSCNYKKDNLIGEWHVTELSEYPLSITNYNDTRLHKHSKLVIRKDGKINFYLKDTLSETYPYYIENNTLVLVYSDYGIPLDIIKLNSKELILETRGFGDTELEINRKIRIELKKTKPIQARTCKIKEQH